MTTQPQQPKPKATYSKGHVGDGTDMMRPVGCVLLIAVFIIIILALNMPV